MRLRVDIGIDAQRHANGRAHVAGDGGEVLELLFAFAVEEAEAVGGAEPFAYGVANFGVGLADACVHALRERNARDFGAVELAARHHIHSRAALSEHAQNTEVA